MALNDICYFFLFVSLSTTLTTIFSPTDEQPPQPEMAQPMLCPFQKEPADLPEKNTISNVANILNRPRKSTDAFNGTELKILCCFWFQITI